MSAEPPVIDEWAVLTHYVNPKGRVIMHAYGGYDTMAKARGAMTRMKTNMRREMPAEATKVTYKVRPILRGLGE